MSDQTLWCQLLYDDLAESQYKPIDPRSRHYDHAPWKYRFRSVFSYYRRDLRRFRDFWFEKKIGHQANLTELEMQEWQEKHLLADGQPRISQFPSNGKRLGGQIQMHHLLKLSRVFPIDIDCEGSPEEAASMARDLCCFLDDIGADYHLFYSGKKGYHVEINAGNFSPLDEAALRGEERVLIPATKIVATRVANLVGIEIDTSVYRRHQKWRRCGCPRKQGRHKILLDDSSNLRHWRELPELSKHEDCYRRRPSNFDDNSSNEILQSFWKRAVELVKSDPPVTVFASGHDISSNSEKVPYTDGSIRSLRAAVKSQSREVKNMGQYKEVQCPAPHHDDSDPSALLNPNGVLVCRGDECRKAYSPAEVAEFVGISLNVEDTQIPSESTDDSGTLDRPPPEKWASMSVKERTDFYERHKKSQVDCEPTDIDGMRNELNEDLNDVISSGESAVVRASVGLGKSHSARVQIVEQNIDVLWLAPTHELLAEAAEHFQQLGSSGHRHLQKFDDIAPNCHQIEMSSGSYMDGDDRERLLGDRTAAPSRADEIQFRQSEMGLSRGSVCGTCPRNPRSESFDPNHQYGRCPFIEHVNDFFDGEEEEPALLDLGTDGDDQKIYLMPTAHVGLTTLDKIMGEVDLVVIDEAAHRWISPVSTFKKSELKRLATPEFMDVELCKAPWDESKVLTFGDLWEAMWKQGERSIQHVFRAFSKEIFEWQSIQDVGPEDDIVHNDGLDTAIKKAGGGPRTHIGLESDTSYPAVVRFLKTLKRGDIIAVHPTVDHHGNEHLLVVERRDTTWADGTPMLVLDATATPHDGRRYDLAFDRSFRDLKYVAENESTEVVQDPERRWSRTKVDAYLNDPETSDKPARDLLDYAKKLEGYVGVISWKDNPLVDELIAEDVISPELVAHYGALRGLDRLAGVDHLIVLSDPTINELAIKQEWCRRGGSMSDYRDHIEFSGDYRTPAYELDYPVSRGTTYRGEQVIATVVEDEICQAIGRARGLTNHCKIYVVSAYDGRMEEFPYRVELGMVRKGSADRQLQRTPDTDQMWSEALSTFKSKRDLAEDNNLSYESVQNMLDGTNLAPYRVHHAERLYEELGSWKAVADRMETTPRTLRTKRKKYGDW